jgi:oligoendopeptidase F
VYHNLLETFRQQLPTWRRYWKVRRRALGVDVLHPYDIWAPLTGAAPEVSYEQAVEWIAAGMAPLGEEYVGTLRRGCLEDRWVDRYPNVGKQQGAFSAGGPGTLPFIKMNYTGNVPSLSTLAHELGHSMHTYLSSQAQPPTLAHYSLFAAEVASNFNQALVRAYLLEHSTDPDFQIALIEEAMGNFYRYYFTMPILAKLELETHTMVEQGGALTADALNNLCADLFAEGYGDEMHVDRDRVGVTWALFQHMYMNFYVFQYTTGIAGAHALARRVLAGEDGAVEAYLGFLKAGGSKYPIDALREAGVDMSTPEPVVAAFEIMAGYIDRLEALSAGR